MAVSALQMETTTERSRVRHRLALGVQWIDAVAQLPAVAAPMRPACGLRITRTGTVASRSSIGGLRVNARMNAPVSRAGRILGAIPPPMYSPRVATDRSATLPLAHAAPIV